MKYIDEYRDGDLARHIAASVAAEADPARDYYLMEFCGGHTHAISRYGLEDLLPANVHMVHGPGCPVCVLPMARIDAAIWLAGQPGVILATYGDMLRVPGSGRLSLMKAKAQGADIRMVYSTQDAVALAQANPGRPVVFFAIGFETTTPPTAVAIRQAQSLGLTNFTVFCNHVLTPPAISGILAGAGAQEEPARLDGFIGPAHVSTVIGWKPYEPFAVTHRRPVVIAGFEPLDVLQAVRMLVRQINDGRAEVENEFARAVTEHGNQKAQDLVAGVFTLRDRFEWRGLGWLPRSALAIRPELAEFDAERRWSVPDSGARDNPACECGAILRGVKKPADCRLFGTVCTPESPMGSCMVSAEGACAAHWTYGRFRDAPPTVLKVKS